MMTAILFAAAPLVAATEPTTVDLSAERAAIERFQAADQRLQDAGWNLVRGNSGFCAHTIAAIGLQLQDIASYGGPDIARAALGLKRDFAVQTAARGSPAGLSGALPRNREIARLGESVPNDWAAGPRMDWQRLVRAHDHVDALLVEDGAITITFADSQTAQLTPVEVCASRFELMGEGRRAVADGNRVVIGIEFSGFAYEEALFAGVIAHELAHNFLRHNEWLERNGRNRRLVRQTEREADRLMPWLLANAGYDPGSAVRFMETWGRRHDGGWLRARTHDGWDERVEQITAELPVIAQLMEREGRADWSVHFRRELGPQSEPRKQGGD